MKKRRSAARTPRDAPLPRGSSATLFAAWGALEEAYLFVDAGGRIVLVSGGARRWVPSADRGVTLAQAGCDRAPWLEARGEEDLTWEGTIPWRFPDGAIREAAARARRVRVRRSLGWLIGLREAKENRDSEHDRELVECRDRFATFMRHLPGVAYMKDLDGRYVFVSESFERHFGHPPEFYLGRLDRDVWPAEVIEELRQSDRLVAESGKVVQTTERVPQADGVHYWLTTKFPIFDEHGGVRLVGGVAVDVTEERRAVEHLRELTRVSQQRERLADVGAITAQILHDLANPVAGLSMQVQLLIRRASRDPHQPVANLWPAARQILAEAQRLDALLREFKDFTREQQLELQLLDLHAFLSDCVTQWRPLARAREVALHAELGESLPPVRADGDKLRRVLDNLIRNSLEAIDRGPGQIWLRSAHTLPEWVRISVLDDGPGIPHSVEPFRLFETTKPYGTGLGLPIAQQIVQAHGGKIWFERLDPRGTAFHLELLCAGPPLDWGGRGTVV